MTLVLTPSRSSLSEQTDVKDWAMRRIDKASIPASSLRGLSEQTDVTDWAMRRIDKGSVPASSLRGLGAARWPVNPLAGPWPVNPLAEQVAVKDWAMRRLDKTSIPASSLRGLGRANYDYTGLGRGWPVNPLAETTFVGQQELRRYGKRFTPASQADLMGFGALDGTVSVRTAQEAMRKIGVCVRLDGEFGPETDGGFLALSQRSQLVPTGSGPFWAAARGASEVRVDTAWWARVTAAASGMVDNCPAGGSGGGGGGGDGGGGGGDGGGSEPDAGGGVLPPEDSWMATLSSPWVLLGIAAAVGAGYWWYNQPRGEWAAPEGGASDNEWSYDPFPA